MHLPAEMTEEEKALARDRKGEFFQRVNALYDLIDGAEDGRSDGYLTLMELRHFFQVDSMHAFRSFVCSFASISCHRPPSLRCQCVTDVWLESSCAGYR